MVVVVVREEEWSGSVVVLVEMRVVQVRSGWCPGQVEE
jgi:hypothetical protein